MKSYHILLSLCLLLLISHISTAQQLAFYQFGENAWSGNDSVLDSSGKGNHASPIGGAAPMLPSEAQISCQVLDVPFNGSLSLLNTTASERDGLDTQLDVDADIGNRGTISFWYRSDEEWAGGGARQLFDATQGNILLNKYFYLALDDGTLQFSLEDSDDNDLTLSVSGLNYGANEWVHVAAVWDLNNDSAQLYLNGSLVTSTLNGGLNGQIGDMTSLYIGDSRTDNLILLNINLLSLSNDSSANGQFDDLRLYAYAQSQTEIIDDKENVTPCSIIHHYRIEHDAQGLTCEAETVSIKACGDEACSNGNVYDLSSTLTLSPNGWAGGDLVTFTGTTTAKLSHTTAQNITFALTGATPDAPLRCFVGGTETCDMAFVNGGMEFFAASIGEQTLPVQIAETDFNHVNIRAVHDEAGVCKASLQGQQTIDFAYDCNDPDSCLTSLAGIPITGPQGTNTGTLEVTFDQDGIASLDMLNYADAGRLTLSAGAALADGTVINTGEKSITVIPSYLGLSSQLSSLATYTAGLNFEVLLTAYGALDGALANYQAGDIRFKLIRSAPGDVSANEGQLKVDGTGLLTSALAPSAVFTNVTNPTPSDGELSYELNYSEVGSILLDV
ncbi:MAG: MSHA biogenesis protein MshQ, partial [Paraglaciecola sp.]